jgi:hypothetical protein
VERDPNYNKVRAVQRSAVTKTPTVRTYAGLQTAFDVFNRELFAGSLPACMISLRTFGKARGYFSPDRFVNLNLSKVTTAHEIAMDPRQFMDRTDVEILSTLAHEMCHLWQQERGTPSRSNGWHNQEWGEKMKEIGLHPSSTAESGGKETGRNVSHYIVEGGPFETVAAKLVTSGRAPIDWADVEGFLMTPAAVPVPLAPVVAGLQAKGAGKSGKRTKYTCPTCLANAWGKDTLLLACAGIEVQPHDPMPMLA